MKPQTIKEMIDAGAIHEEAAKAQELFVILRPGLKIKRENGRIETSGGDKTVLGLYRTIANIVNKDIMFHLCEVLEWAKGQRGRKDGNPYLMPEIKAALKHLAQLQGISDWLDARTKKGK